MPLISPFLLIFSTWDHTASFLQRIWPKRRGLEKERRVAQQRTRAEAATEDLQGAKRGDYRGSRMEALRNRLYQEAKVAILFGQITVSHIWEVYGPVLRVLCCVKEEGLQGVSYDSKYCVCVCYGNTKEPTVPGRPGSKGGNSAWIDNDMREEERGEVSSR